jgi:hypothetical protein
MPIDWSFPWSGHFCYMKYVFFPEINLCHARPSYGHLYFLFSIFHYAFRFFILLCHHQRSLHYYSTHTTYHLYHVCITSLIFTHIPTRWYMCERSCLWNHISSCKLAIRYYVSLILLESSPIPFPLHAALSSTPLTSPVQNDDKYNVTSSFSSHPLLPIASTTPSSNQIL